MKLINYIGTEGPSVVIERPEDLYAYLDYFHTKMCEMSDHFSGKSEQEDRNGYSYRALIDKTFAKHCDECAVFIEKLMEMAEKNGFGNQDDIDNIKY